MILNNSKPEYYTGYTDPRFYQSLICSDTILILVINLTGVLFISDCDILSLIQWYQRNFSIRQWYHRFDIITDCLISFWDLKMFHFIQCIATFIHMYFDAQDEQLDVIYLVIDNNSFNKCF